MDLSRRNPLSAFLRQGFAKDQLDLDHITPVCKGAKSLCLLVLFRAWAQKNEERRASQTAQGVPVHLVGQVDH